jgi:hypothetical protein
MLCVLLAMTRTTSPNPRVTMAGNAAHANTGSPSEPKKAVTIPAASSETAKVTEMTHRGQMQAR